MGESDNQTSGATAGLQSPPREIDKDEALFQSLSRKWKEETGAESSLSNITSNINYLKVIKMGDRAIPFILRELRSEPAPWFLALRVITEEPNVGMEHSGNFRKMAGAWIRWGEQHGYI